MSRLLKAVLGAAILTIGLTEYRPVVPQAGNLSDILFLVVFGLGASKWLLTLGDKEFLRLIRDVRNAEILLWGGLALTLGGVAASIESGSQALSWQSTLKYFITFCVWLPWVTVAVRRYLSLEMAYLLYLVGLALVAAMTLSDVLVRTRFGAWLVSTSAGVTFEDLVGLRYGGPTGHPNSLGSLSAIGLLASVPFVTGKRTWRAVTAGTLGCVVFGSSLLVSGSRAGLLGAGLGFLVMMVLGSREAARRIAVLLLGCLAGLWLISSAPGLSRALPQNPLARLLESVSPRRDFEADWSRRRDLGAAARLLRRDPLTGYGMENVGTSAGQTVGFNLHNTILQSWLAGGLLGALGAITLYAGALGAGWIAVRRRYPLSLALFAISVSMILIDLTQPHLYQRFRWFAVALLFASLRDEAVRPAPHEVGVRTGALGS